MKSSAEANTRNQLDNSTVYYHRLNRRSQNSICRSNGLNNSKNALVGWSDARGWKGTGAIRKPAENPKPRGSYSSVEPMRHVCDVGLTGDRKTFSPSLETLFFSAQSKIRCFADQNEFKPDQTSQGWSQGSWEQPHGRNQRVNPWFGRNRRFGNKNGIFSKNWKAQELGYQTARDS